MCLLFSLARTSRMQASTRHRLQLAAVAALVCFLGLSFVYRAWDRRESVRTALLWGRLAPLPASAHGLYIRKTGSPFTRELRISYRAAPEEIQKWLETSPGTRGLRPERPTANLRKFSISPGGGAQYAEVRVDDSLNEVWIRVYWS